MENIFFRVRFFGKFRDIEADSDLVWDLMGELRKLKLLPTTIHEVNAHKNSVTSIPRPAFVSRENDLNVEIGSDVITIEMNNNKSNIKNIKEFCNDAIYILDKILISFKRKGNRVSLITNSFLDINSEQLQETYPKIISPINFYQNNKPFEWNSRSVSRIKYNIAGLEENINVINEIARVQGNSVQSGVPVEFDKISVIFDINTIAQSTDNRLDINSIEEFLKEAINTRKGIVEQLEEMLYE